MTNPIPIRIFVDSAVREEAEPWLRTGLVHGVTTNPTLLRRAGLGVDDIAEVARWATGDGEREVCFQLWGHSAEEQYAAAMRIREQAPAATMKIPVTPTGARVITRLHEQQVPVLMTAVYAAKQVAVASALGVRYLAPYFNRMQVAGRDALSEIQAMTRAVPQDGTGPLVMAASVKSAQQVMALVGAGVRVFTLPPAVIADLFDDELTTRAVVDFEADMQAVLG
ncbi:transaldolase family protein [Luteococcus sp. OSA5]|uniref:transaldolase family protein n=1 Tax=Luteococcus sp. OSA5 TaxID=3401630 RepID=UPI003B42E860